MNKRNRVRFISDIPVKVTCLTPPLPPVKGRLANLSAYGLSVIVGKELPHASSIKVEWGGCQFIGELVYCNPHGKEFLAGLNVETPIYETKKPAATSNKNVV